MDSCQDPPNACHEFWIRLHNKVLPKRNSVGNVTEHDLTLRVIVGQNFGNLEKSACGGDSRTELGSLPFKTGMLG